jgi:hypothetical protein
MTLFRKLVRFTLAVPLLFPLLASAQYHSSITYQNGSGATAVVRLVGPSGRVTTVSRGGSQSEASVAPGRYHIVVRYGNEAGRYSYTKGDPFVVAEAGNQYSEISITLYSVPNGNYGSRPAREDEFDNP